MKLDRIPYEPGALVDFYEAGLTAVGALCSRTWHDRLEVVAEGPAARLWNPDGTLHSVELQFAPAGASGAREAAREVFPGCPLTFRLAEALRPAPLALERVTLAADGSAARAPDVPLVEKLWRSQYPDTTRWRQAAPFVPAFHFSLVALVRCEIQAIDQHWSLHRLAVALPGGEPDDTLAAALDFAELSPEAPAELAWPHCDAAQLGDWLGRALTETLGPELTTIRKRQEDYLRRELERIDAYFSGYAQELSDRAARTHSDTVKLKADQRLAAAQAEHTRRRADQVQRHEIRILPRLDTLLLLAEPAWQTTITTAHHGETASLAAHYVPRNRRWVLDV